MKKRKNNLLFMGLLGMVAILIFVSFSMTLRNVAIETKEVEVTFEVGDELAVDVNQSILTLGVLTEGTTILRNVLLRNGKDYPVKVITSASTDIREHVFVEEVFYAAAGETIEVPVSVSIEQGKEHGKYSGKIYFEIYKTEGG